ncbi:uncharacterized protein LOC108259384 isoform X1 [Ictalurus punctatus]|uniref:Uncharacterized protein LOC108259384 isoform X1 n=1 Tax=Ictalurus punctatus TaxID=7998 RepID=A0A9F7TGM0_ICTPU|nr:uncharacterized protein LOC108259384 isoform X1 [Ictalurus punctatus]XP_053532473.1 uncharacterized protein LOC108259384 isoform X1 [Ictalurus punctatus]
MLNRTRLFSTAAVLMLLAGVQAQRSVTLSSQSLCAVTGSTVKIPCTYSSSYYRRPKEWYRVQSSEGEPRDLSKDPQYSGRVSVRTVTSDCELTVRNVRASDSGVYNFRFKTWSSGWISAPSGVHLTVTDLQVKVDPNTVGQRELELTCSATCSFSTHRFYWYRNGQFEQYLTEASIVIDSTHLSNVGSYSCQVYESQHRSPSVCVLGKECWGVTYTPERVCALKDTSIDLSCSYKHPAGHTVIKSVWFIKDQTGVEPVDVREDEEYQGRVQYTQISQNNCSLRITNLRERDAQTYRFRFYTDGGKYTGQPGVSLSVTDLKVTVSDWGSWNKKLSCITTCTLSNDPTYIWYKNGQRVTDRYINELDVKSEESGSYSCAVRGHEELRSPAVCVLDEKSCWSVTYSTQNICSLIGSSVDIHSYYTFPNRYKVTKVFWFIKDQTGVEAVDVREDEEYQGRVQYTQISQNNCRLRITNLRETHAQTYRFRFYTDGGKYTGQPGVSLSVTDLKVTVSNSGSWKKKLSCITTCTLSNDPTYIWYKNGQRVTDRYINELDVKSEESGSYSCAVRGHEELRSPAVCVFSEKSCWSVTYSTQNICSLIGSSVDIHSYYTFPNRYKVTKVFWFIKDQTGVEPVDVREDEEYQGRVQYTQISQNNCRLRITNLRERDAQTYRFRFYTDDPTGEYTGDPGVSLSVTDLKVRVSDWGSWKKKLSCITTCTLSSNPTYIWYKNGQRVTDRYINELDVKSEEPGSYSCAVRGHEELRSPAVCVLDEKSCWSVTYSTQNICSLIGSSVDIHSYYTFPNHYKVTEVFWFIKDQTGVEPVDVREDEEYQGRVQYTQISQNNCSLRITNLRERDTQTYRFRFYTDVGKYTGDPGVSLSVTDLKVTVSDWREQYMNLICITTCTLSNNPTYIWYKNGQRVSECKSASCSVAAVGGAVSYSCAVEGHDSLLSPPVYSPKNTRAVVLSSGDTEEGDSVTLSCSSDANPPVLAYSWFKQRAAADTLLTTGQNYSISNISSQHSGLYYCTAHNRLGQHNSTPTLLDVLYLPKNTRAVVLSSGDTVEGGSVTLSCSSDANPPVLTYSWFKQRAAADTLLTTGQNYSISNISSQHSGLYYCTAHNRLGQHNSTPTHLDVLYSPRNTSIVPSVSGDLFTLVCRSDSNPNSSYTWYKKTEGDVKIIENGTNLTLSSRADGFYYCKASNGFGSSNSSEWEHTSDTDNSVVKYAASGVTVALVLLVLLFIAVFLWIRRRASLFSNRSEDNSKNNSAPVYGNVSAMTSDPTQTASSEDQDNLQYSSVYFRNSHTQEAPLYSTVQLTEEVEYATVSLAKSRAVPEDEIYNNLKLNQ